MKIRTLLLFALLFGSAIFLADGVFNRPILDRVSGPRVIYGDARPAVHYWTMILNDSEIGLIGFSQGKHTARTTDIRFGRRSVDVPVSIFAFTALLFLTCISLLLIAFAVITGAKRKTA